MHYTYIIRSLSQPDERHIGMTDDMDQRLKTHNEGGSAPTPVPTRRSCGYAFDPLNRRTAKS